MCFFKKIPLCFFILVKYTKQKIQHRNHFTVHISVALSASAGGWYVAITLLSSRTCAFKAIIITSDSFCPRRTLLEGWVCRTAGRHGGELEDAEGKRDTEVSVLNQGRSCRDGEGLRM